MKALTRGQFSVMKVLPLLALMISTIRSTASPLRTPRAMASGTMSMEARPIMLLTSFIAIPDPRSPT